MQINGNYSIYEESGKNCPFLKMCYSINTNVQQTKSRRACSLLSELPVQPVAWVCGWKKMIWDFAVHESSVPACFQYPVLQSALCESSSELMMWQHQSEAHEQWSLIPMPAEVTTENYSLHNGPVCGATLSFMQGAL